MGTFASACMCTRVYTQHADSKSKRVWFILCLTKYHAMKTSCA